MEIKTNEQSEIKLKHKKQNQRRDNYQLPVCAAASQISRASVWILPKGKALIFGHQLGGSAMQCIKATM